MTSLFSFSNEVGVSATITLPVPKTQIFPSVNHGGSWFNEHGNQKRARVQNMQTTETNYIVNESEAIPIDQNIDNEEDEKLDYSNQEVASFFTSKNQIFNQTRNR